MRSVSVHEAKTHLSKLLRAVEAGEDVEIRRGRQTVALLTQPASRTDFRDLRNRFAADVWIADDFDELDEETARAFGVVE